MTAAAWVPATVRQTGVRERVVIARLELPLPLDLAGSVMRAIGDGLEAEGWTGVVLLTDGTNRIAATPPADDAL